MPITVAHTPSAEVIAQSAYMGGLGDWQRYQREIELREEALRSQQRQLQLQLRDRQISQAQAQKHQKEMAVLDAQLGELAKQKDFVRQQSRDTSLHRNVMQKAQFEAGTEQALQGMKGEQSLAEIGLRGEQDIGMEAFKGDIEMGLEREKARLREQSDVASMAREQAMKGWEYDEQARRELDKYDAYEKQINEDDTLTPYEKEQAYRELNFKRMGIQPTKKKSPYPEGQDVGDVWTVPETGATMTRDENGIPKILTPAPKPATPPSFKDVSGLVADAVKAATNDEGVFNKEKYNMILSESVDIYKRMTGSSVNLPPAIPSGQDIGPQPARNQMDYMGAGPQIPQGEDIGAQPVSGVTPQVDPRQLQEQAISAPPPSSQITDKWLADALPPDPEGDGVSMREIAYQVLKKGKNPRSADILMLWNKLTDKEKWDLLTAFNALGITQEAKREQQGR